MIHSRHPKQCAIDDFDVVVHKGRTLVVVDTADTWDPRTDQWTEFQLDPHPWGGIEDFRGIGAAVVDDRIVIGGGAEHSPFAQWDLESGRSICPEQEGLGCVDNVSKTVLNGRELFVIGCTGPQVYLWVPGEPEPALELLDDFEECMRHAAGTLWNRTVLFGAGESNLWDIEAQCRLDVLPERSHDSFSSGPDTFAIVDGPKHVRLVEAGDQTVIACNPDADEWQAPLTVSGAVTSMDAGSVGGLPVAVTGSEDGTVRAWDLLNNCMLPEPATTHADAVTSVQLAELDGRPAVYSADRGGGVRVQSFE